MENLPPLPDSFDTTTMLRALYAFIQALSARVKALEAPRPQPAPPPKPGKIKPQPGA